MDIQKRNNDKEINSLSRQHELPERLFSEIQT